MSRYLVQASWDDAPHLDEKAKAEMLKALQPHERDARTRGIPYLGAGLIYPIEESSFTVKPFDIPRWWPRAFGLDVGNKTAAIWMARDIENKVDYFYSEYFREGEEPSVHAAAIKSRGAWIPGVIDPAARGRSQIDGRNLLQMYRDQGLKLTTADNAVDSGIYQVWTALVNGQLKVFSTMTRWLQEWRIYRRDEKGRIVKKDDHCQDASRYLFVSGRDIAKQQTPQRTVTASPAPSTWMT